MVILENIDIDKAILQNIDNDKISNRFKVGISNRARSTTQNLAHPEICFILHLQEKISYFPGNVERLQSWALRFEAALLLLFRAVSLFNAVSRVEATIRQALMSCASVSFCQQSMCWRVVRRLYSSTNHTKVVPLRHNLTPLSHLGTIWHHLASGVDRNWINICELQYSTSFCHIL